MAVEGDSGPDPAVCIAVPRFRRANLAIKCRPSDLFALRALRPNSLPRGWGLPSALSFLIRPFAPKHIHAKTSADAAERMLASSCELREDRRLTVVQEVP